MSSKPLLQFGLAASLAFCAFAPAQAALNMPAPAALQADGNSGLTPVHWRRDPYGYRTWRHGWRARPWHRGYRPWYGHPGRWHHRPYSYY